MQPELITEPLRERMISPATAWANRIVQDNEESGFSCGKVAGIFECRQELMEILSKYEPKKPKKPDPFRTCQNGWKTQDGVEKS